MKNEEYDKIIGLAFGKEEVENFTEREAEIARRAIAFMRERYKESLEEELASEIKKNGTDGEAARWAVAIKSVLSTFYGKSWEEISSKGRSGELVEARHMAFFLMAKNTDYPKMHMPKLLGLDNSHCNVLYGIQAISNRMDFDKSFRKRYETVCYLLDAFFEGADIQNICAELNR